jgi:glutathione S-transferase
MSPFCVKLETYLKMAGIEYRSKAPNFAKAPKGRIPYVEFEGQIMGDSGLIIEEFKKRFGDPLDAKLTSEQRARAVAVGRLIEDHLYFAGAYLRWSDQESWEYVRDFFKSILPPVIGGLIIKKIRKDFLKDIQTQGMGKHTRDEVIALAREDLTAISVLLGDQPYFLGSEPTSIDATLYGFLIQYLWTPWDGPLKPYARSLRNLSDYCDRMKARYWS